MVVVTNADLPESLTADAVVRVPKTEPELNSILLTDPAAAVRLPLLEDPRP